MTLCCLEDPVDTFDCVVAFVCHEFVKDFNEKWVMLYDEC